MTPFADGYQVILYALLSEALVAFGAVVYLQGVARAVFVTQPALVAVQGDPGVTFGFPLGRTHVAFIGGLVHRVLCWAGSLPCLAMSNPANSCLAASRLTLSGHISNGLTQPHRTMSRRAQPCVTPKLVAARQRCSLPYLAAPRQDRPDHAKPRRAQPRLATSLHTIPDRAGPRLALEKEISLPTCFVVALAEGRTRVWADRQANACNRNRKCGFTSFSTPIVSHSPLSCQDEF